MAKSLKISKEAQIASKELLPYIGFNPLEEMVSKANIVLKVSDWIKNPEISNKMALLEGSPMGFTTDLSQENKKYDEKTRSRCVTQALMQCANVVNNEFGIIKGNVMMLKNYYERQLKSMGHESNPFTINSRYKTEWFDVEEGEIKQEGGMVKIPYKVTLSLFDKQSKKSVEEIVNRVITVPVKRNDNSDAWLGKGRRRVLKAVFERFSGVMVNDSESDLPGNEGVVNEPSVGIEVNSVKVEDDVKPKQIEKGGEAKKKPYKATKEQKQTPVQTHDDPYPIDVDPTPLDSGQEAAQEPDNPIGLDESSQSSEDDIDDIFGDGAGL